MRITISLVVLIGILLTGCSYQTVKKPLIQETIPGSFPSKPSATQLSVSPSQTLAVKTLTLLVTPRPSPTETPNQLPIRSMENKCLSFKETNLAEFVSTGQLVLIKYHSRINGIGEVQMFGSEINAPILLEDTPEYHGPLFVSNDKKRLVYGTNGADIVLSADGEIEASIPVQERWGPYFGWLNDQRLFYTDSKDARILYLVNPISNEWETVAYPFNDIYHWELEASGWMFWKLDPDPTLKRVLYMRNSVGPELALYDLEKRQMVWQLLRYSPGENKSPVWSPDGEQVFVTVVNEVQDNYQRYQLIAVSRDGISTEWVDIADGITFDESNPSLSPNGRYLAFHGKSLYVLDMQKQKLIDLCIPPNPDEGGDYGIIGWSPDSSQFFYQRYKMAGLVIDFERGEAVSIDADPFTEIVGWMISPSKEKQ